MVDEALVARVEHLLGIGRADEAAALAAEGLQQDPESIPLLSLMARAQLLLDNYPAAINAAQYALALEPGAIHALMSLTDAYSLVERHDDALAAADAAVQLAPHMSATFYMRAAVRNRAVTPFVAQAGGRTARDRFNLALADLDQAIELSPSASSFHALRGEILIRAGRKREARDALNTAVQINPQNATALALLGDLNIDQLRLTEAQQDISAGLGADPHSQHLQRRSREFLRARALLPVWVAALTPALAFGVSLLVGNRLVTAAVVVIGTIASIGFAIWWWRHLPPAGRNRFVFGDARRVLIVASILWVLMTLAGLVYLFAEPSKEFWSSSGANTPGAESPDFGGADLLAMLTVPLAGVGPMVALIVWLQSRSIKAASNLGERLSSRSKN